MGEYRLPPNDIMNTLKDIQRKLRALALTQNIPTYTTATRPPASSPQVIFVSDASSGQRFQGWDTTAGGWVPLG